MENLLSYRIGKVFKGRKGVEKRNLLAKMYFFRQGHPPKGNGSSLSVYFLVLIRKFQVDWLKLHFWCG